MLRHTDNETWVIEEGARVVQKIADSGLKSLTPFERLVYSLWIADYGMRNGESLLALGEFQTIAVQASVELSLPLTLEMFSMELRTFEKEYLDRFDCICDEIRTAVSPSPRKLNP